jgi:ANTAR domain/GAF domain
MTTGRAALLWSLVAGHAARHQAHVSAVDVCAVAVEALPAGGACVIAQGAMAGYIMCVTDEVSEQLAELQVTLGEGPWLEAVASGSPVLISDLDDEDAARRWPGFILQAREFTAAAIFAFPLQIGGIRFGSLGLYRDKPGQLSTLSLGDALILADAATVVLLESQHTDGAAPRPGAGPAGQPPALAHHRAEIDQATGMVSAQLGVAIAEAFVRLRAHAYAQDRRLTDVARDIVARRLRLSHDPDPPRDHER